MKITIKSKFLTAEMVKAGYKKGRIDAKNIRFEEFDGKAKLVIPIVFNVDGIAETVEYVPNKTMHRAIIEAYGDDSDNLDGKELNFSVTKVNFQGKMVDSVVVTPEKEGGV